jgi:hypothetical protein
MTPQLYCGRKISSMASVIFLMMPHMRSMTYSKGYQTMKNGHAQKLLEGVTTRYEEVRVTLTEGDVEIATIYVQNEKEANRLIESWKDGTYKLLME